MNDLILKSFGLHIKQLRKDAEISQEELAARSGLDRTYISGIERGLRNVSLINLLKLAQALGVVPEELLKFEVSND